MAHIERKDPCFWLTTSEDARRERERTKVVKGKKITEKFPQHGHDGDYDNKRPAPGRRFVYVIRHDGNEIAMVLTNAAAHLDPNTGYGNYVRRKARHLGWFPSGACPLALVVARELTPDHLASDEVRAAAERRELGCEAGTHNRAKPCRHDLLEREARRNVYNEEQAERLAAFKPEAERVAADMRAANRELVKDIVTELVGAPRSVPPEPTPPEPAPPEPKPEQKGRSR